MKRRGTLGFLVVGVLLLGSCRDTSNVLRPYPYQATSVRFVEEDPGDIFSPADVGRVTTVRDWVFSGAMSLDGWSTERAEMHLRQEAGLFELTSTRGVVFLERQGPLEADSIYAVRIAYFGVVPTATRLEWAREGEKLSVDRSVSVPVRLAKRGEVRLVLGTHPEWTGKIEKLRLRFATGQGRSFGTVKIKRILFEGLEVDEDRLVAALARPWKVNGGDELRNALLGLPGLSIRREVQIPQDATLAFSISVPPTARNEVSFSVAIEPVASGSREVLWSETVAPGAGSDWREESIDLGSYAGRRAALLMETASPHPIDPLRGIPAWGSPEILVASSAPSLPNVVLISVDTLRADHLSLYGYPVATSPNIDDWARRRAVTFETTVAQAPWTLPSHVSMFTGLNAMSHGVNYPLPAPGRLRMMAEILRQAGYTTAAFTGGSYLHPRFGLSQGFDLYASTSVGPRDEMEQGVGRTLEWLDGVGDRRPFFLLFHTYEVHDPYYVRGLDEPRPTDRPTASSEIAEVTTSQAGGGVRRASRGYDVVFADGRREEVAPTPDVVASVRSLYDSSIVYMDEGVGRILSKLTEKGLENETLVVFTSDHGEALGEQGLVGHGLPYDHNLLVPLIIALPDGSFAGRRVPSQVRSIDILPTILEVLGIDEEVHVDGRSLLPLMRGDEATGEAEALAYAALSNYGLVIRQARGRKYILSNTPWREAEKREELYDLIHDPGETHDLNASSNELSAFRRRALSLLRENARGLEITVAAPTGVKQLCGTLRGPDFSLSAVKQNSVEPCCERRRRDGLEFCVRPHEPLTLNLESVTSPKLRLAGRFPRSSGLPPLDVRLDAAALSSGLVLIPSEKGWISASHGTDSSVPTVRLRWRGESWTSAGSPADEEPALRKQLEALGYLN